MPRTPVRAPARPRTGTGPDATAPDDLSVDVGAVIDRKVAALVAHRSQYALDPELLPRQVLAPLLRTEHFSVAL